MAPTIEIDEDDEDQEREGQEEEEEEEEETTDVLQVETVSDFISQSWLL